MSKAKTTKKKAAAKIPSEHMEQVQFISWFRKTYPGVLIWATPNGGHRHAVAAMKLKAEGVLAGVPDLFIPEWRLFVEMKRQKSGRLSPAQKDMIEKLDKIGYDTIIGHGFEDAKEKVLEWLKSYQQS